MNFRRDEQWLLSSEGANIHQTKYTTGVGYTAYAFAGSEIQKRSYPNSYGGQWQNRGYELVQELKLVENARRVGEEAVADRKSTRLNSSHPSISYAVFCLKKKKKTQKKQQ